MALSSQNKSNKINPSHVSKLIAIFKTLGWKITSDEYTDFDYADLFNNFCEFLACLTEEEIELVLELTENFLHYRYTMYPTLMETVLSKVPEKYLDECNGIYLIPLINPKDIGRPKSSTGSLYSLLHVVIPKFKKINNKLAASYENPMLLADKHGMRKKSLIIFFDDFIGSGLTAEKALSHYNSEIRNKCDIPIIVSLVAQLHGIIKIEELGFEIFTSELIGRCFSDSINMSNKCKKVKMMRKIENSMGVSKTFRLGLNKSQALISMIRTPNNTLPIYWWLRKPDRKKWNGIFRRY